jgi:predicted MFS family arabinose efflux permease
MNTKDAALLRPGIAKPTPPVRMALAGLGAFAVAMGVGRFSFTPIMPMMLRDTGLTVMDAGWLGLANHVGYLLGALSAMLIQCRFELMIRIGLIGICIATAVMGISHSFFVWILLRLLVGASSALVLIGISTWCLERLAVYQRPLLISLVFSGGGIGVATTALVCIALTEHNVGPDAAWILLGIMSIGITGLTWTAFSVAQPVAVINPQAGTGIFRYNAGTIRFVCCYGIFGFGYIIAASFLPAMLKNALSSSSAYTWSWPVFGIVAAAATLAVAALKRRIGNRGVWATSHLIMAVGILLPVVWPGTMMIVASALCVAGTAMVVTLVALLESRPVAGNDAPLLIAAMTATFAIGQLIGVLIARAGTISNDGFSPSLILASVLLACSTLLLKRSRSDD